MPKTLQPNWAAIAGTALCAVLIALAFTSSASTKTVATASPAPTTMNRYDFTASCKTIYSLAQEMASDQDVVINTNAYKAAGDVTGSLTRADIQAADQAADEFLIFKQKLANAMADYNSKASLIPGIRTQNLPAAFGWLPGQQDPQTVNCP